MYVSLNWLKDFVDIPQNLSPQELGDLLTLKTAEVEQVENQEESYANMVTGKILSLEKHPDADKLQIAKVDVGEDKPLQIVCGGSNLREEMSVAITKIGAKVRWHGEGDLITLKKAKVRGVESEGMIAAGSEIGVDDPGAGERDILDLSASDPTPGTPLAEYLNRNDSVLEFDNKSLTHRPDLWGHYGIAREVAAITKGKLKPLNPSVQIPQTGESLEVKIEDFELCPRYCGLIIENIKVEESPDWLKQRLQAVGHGTHNNIVDVTNYIVAELGQPMHAFDKNFIEGGIVVRRAENKEKITTLDNKERELSKDMLVIADHQKAVAIAGVMGGQNSEIKAETSAIILESATFNAGSIRRTSTKLGLRTEAVQRFEKSLDPELAELAIKRAAEIILQICPGAKIAGPITDIQQYDKTPLIIELDTKKARSKIGIDIDNKEIEKILTSLEFQVKEKGENLYEVTVPSFRATKDVTIEDDLIEEIARIYGYDNIEPELPTLPTRVPPENIERFKKHRTRELLSYGLGFSEAYNYSFYGVDDLARCLMSEEGHLQLQNYLSAEQTHLRTSLIPNLLKNIEHNLKYQDQFKLYEIGRTYKEIGEYMPLEEKQIAGVIVKRKKTDSPFYEAKGAVEAFFKKFRIEKVSATPDIKNAPYAHPVQSLSYIDRNAQTIAQVFTLHPVVAKNHGLSKQQIAFFKINYTEALKIENEGHSYTPLPKFPSIEFDVSVLVDKEIEVGKLREAVEKADQELISNVQLFDIYQGENIDEDKKAVAYKITLMSPERTLTDAEMAAVQAKVFQNLEKIGGKIRGK